MVHASTMPIETNAREVYSGFSLIKRTAKKVGAILPKPSLYEQNKMQVLGNTPDGMQIFSRLGTERRTNTRMNGDSGEQVTVALGPRNQGVGAEMNH
jgi:hypothetical protein